LGDPDNDVLSGDVTVFFTPSDNIDTGNCTLLLNGTLNETVDADNDIENNITILGLSEGYYYWDVNCSDLSNNSAVNGSVKYFWVDNTQPTAFDLVSPTSGTVSINDNPTFVWSQTSEDNFANYTILIDNDISFSSVLETGYTYQITNTSHVFVSALWDQTLWYWKVIAYDIPGNNRESNQIFNYTVDKVAPSISLQSPIDGDYLNYLTVQFNYTVSDFTDLLNCSLLLNGAIDQTNTTVNRSATNTFTKTFPGTADYNWSVECYDSAENYNVTVNRSLTIDVDLPSAFNLVSPINSTNTSDNTPLFDWDDSSDDNFYNYTLQISNVSDFSVINYEYSTSPVSNSSYQVSSGISDGLWYWRVVAYDLADNSRTSTPPLQVLTIDTVAPDAFDLSAPANDSVSQNLTPTFTWQATSDDNFRNYTVLVDDSPTFGSVDYENYTYSVSDTDTLITLSDNTKWYWRVIAYDWADASTNSTSTYEYTTDNTLPIISLVAPDDGDTWNSSPTIQFQFDVEEINDIDNCSLIINGSVSKTSYSISNSSTNTIADTLDNGFYEWSVNCTDEAGNKNASDTRSLTVNVVLPRQVYYETLDGGSSYSVFQNINLSPNYDLTENSLAYSVPGAGSYYEFINASYYINGSGVQILQGSDVNFSAVFTAQAANQGSITWEFYKINSTGHYLICSYGDRATGGVLITDQAKTTYASPTSCVTTEEFFIHTGDTLRLTMGVYNAHPQARTYTHFWDNADASYVAFEAFMYGNVSINVTQPDTDPQPEIDEEFNVTCEVECLEGTCYNTEVTIQRNTSTLNWTTVGASGNIVLADGESATKTAGDIINATQINFTLVGND
jgi:hypothetical protein